MQTHYKIIIATTTFAVAALAGCKEPEKYLRTDPGSIEMTADELGAGITVEATASWMVDAIPLPADWIEELEYYNDNMLWVTVTGANESLEPRSTEITIVSGDGLTAVVPLVQLAKDVWLDVSPVALEPFDAEDAAPQTLTVETNLEGKWEFVKSEDWLTVTRGTDGEGGENTLTISVRPSRELDKRRDTIIVRPSHEAYAALADTIPVVQRGLELVVDADEFMNGSYDIVLPSRSVEAVLMIYARAAWTVSVANDAGGRASLNLTGGDADINEGAALVLTLPENLSTAEYTFTLVFQCAGETYEYQVVQAAAAGEDGAGA